MKGLELCERYFQERGLPELERTCGSFLDRMAIGLVGDGSECYGYDDELSRDHDWGPGFCIWLTGEDHEAYGEDLRLIYATLPGKYAGHGPRQTSRWGEDRVGVAEIGTFYRRFVGRYQPPTNCAEWMVLPENALAAATNGKVFHDPLGEFSRIRSELLRFYPEDVRRKKIAARCMSIGQAGQYNFARCVKRREFYAAHHAETSFCADAMSMVFLLNRRYAPFYKWTHRAVSALPKLGSSIHQDILRLVCERDYAAKVEGIESIAQSLILELRRQGLTDRSSDFLPDHGPAVQQGIEDERLRETSIFAG